MVCARFQMVCHYACAIPGTMLMGLHAWKIPIHAREWIAPAMVNVRCLVDSLCALAIPVTMPTDWLACKIQIRARD